MLSAHAATIPIIPTGEWKCLNHTDEYKRCFYFCISGPGLMFSNGNHFFLTDETYKTHVTYYIWIHTIISRVFISHIWQHFYGRSFVKLRIYTALFFIISFIFPIKVLLLLCDIHVRVCVLWCTRERQKAT